MDDLWTVIALSFAMLIGCYLAGSIPLAFSFSDEKLKLVTVFGAGLLVGTSLAVIIPEGVHTLYDSSNKHSHKHSHNPVKDVKIAKDEHSHVHGHDNESTDVHSLIGVTLVAGFIFMLLVDQLSHGHSHQIPIPDNESGSAPTIQSRSKITATIGLVVHAAADGVALGAAVSMSQAHVTMIVFIAIMLHKAPAAFGLVSFLLHDGLDRVRIRKHLMVFAGAAPLLAIITFLCLSRQSKEALSDVNATGIAMLFSAGTFLYVATVHVLPEIANMSSKTINNGITVVHEHKGFTKCELLVMVMGAVIPVILSVGHKH